MNQKLKYISRIKDDFDIVICGVNGVLMRGNTIYADSIDALVKLYQSGKKVALASNSGMRVKDLYYFLKHKDVPMNIFYAMITAGEIAHFYLRNHNLGKSYYSLTEKVSRAAEGLNYNAVDSMVMADFIIAETDGTYQSNSDFSPLLEQALHLRLPLLCIGNNTSLMHESGVVAGMGVVAEKYALMGGKVIPFGKPDVRIAAYLTEGIPEFQSQRCLVIGDNMSTDMRMGNNFAAQTLLIAGGVHQLQNNFEQQLNDLSESYGLNIDYYTETLQW